MVTGKMQAIKSVNMKQHHKALLTEQTNISENTGCYFRKARHALQLNMF